MATFKAVVLRHHKKEDGTYNIKIRVTHNRAVRYLPTRMFLTRHEITGKMKIKDQSVIDALDQTVKKYRDACNALGDKLDDMNVDQVVTHIKLPSGGKDFHLDFIAFGRETVTTLREEGREGTARCYEITLNALIRFTGTERLDIAEITTTFLKKFVNWINERPSPSSRPKGSRAQSLYTSNIRALHNKAKDTYNEEDEGLIRIPQSPFKKFSIPRLPPVRKRALSVDAIRAIAALPCKPDISWGENRYNLARDVFLLSFGLVGMNSIDLYRCDRMEGDRIIYRRTKTADRRADGAEISIRIEPEIRPLVEKYRDPDGKQVFRFYRMYADSVIFNAAINKGLKKIGAESAVRADDLEFYAARHSWATIAANIARVDKYTIHTALNHTDSSMKVTDIYIDRDYSLIDEANRKVLDCLNLPGITL
jgi:integrase